MKIIQISSASSSHSVRDYEGDIPKAWHSQVCYQLKKFDKNLNIESWTIERKYEKEGEKFYNGIKFRVFPANVSIRHGMEISLSMARALKKEIELASRKNERLIIHLHEHHTWQSYLLLSSIDKTKNRNIKIISQHHGGRSPFQNLKKYKKLYWFLPVFLLMQLSEKILFKKIDMVYGESVDELRYLNKIFPTHKFRFQTMGIENEYFANLDKKLARKKLGLDKNKKYLLFLGRPSLKKGMRELLDAMRQMQNDTNLELLVIGGGPECDFYKNYAAVNQIKNVKFLGTIYGNEKLLYLSACDCLVLPSYTESCPVVLMEAIARNLPVIATPVGGIPLMIEKNKEGILIKPQSSMEIIQAIKEILNWKTKNIKKNAEKYKWNKIIKQTLNDYGYNEEA